MAMTARLWSISALAVEVNMDRRTVAKRLRGVRPDGRVNGASAWLLTTALPALRGERATTSPPGKPENFPPWLEPVLELETPFASGFMLGHLWTVNHAAVLGAWAVSLAGGKMDLAHEVARILPMLIMHEQGKFAAKHGIEPWKSTEDPDIYDADGFQEPDWRRLAAEVGEPDWRPPQITPVEPEA